VCPGFSLGHRSPQSCEKGSFFRGASLSLPESVNHLPTVRSADRILTPVSFQVPSTASLRRAPHETGCHPRPGSARRLSQPHSGFQANPSFAALFRAATVPGILPSECSPRRSRAPLSGPLASLQLSTDVLNRAARDLITARFTDSHAFTQLPGSPDDYELPFVAPEGTLPGHPGSQPPEPIRSASFTCFEAFFLLRVRSHWIRLPLTSGRSSLGFRPLQSLSIHASDPVT